MFMIEFVVPFDDFNDSWTTRGYYTNLRDAFNAARKDNRDVYLYRLVPGKNAGELIPKLILAR